MNDLLDHELDFSGFDRQYRNDASADTRDLKQALKTKAAKLITEGFKVFELEN